jgi:uncharacterized membrane protein YfcA
LGFSAALVGAIAAGGGLISVPGMIYLGLSPVNAIATTRLNVISGGLTAIYRYRRGGFIVRNYLPVMTFLAILAGLLGSKLLLLLNPELIKRLVGWSLILLLPIIWYKKETGTTMVERSKNRRLLGYPAFFLILIYATTFGGGAGLFLIYAGVYFFGMNITQANATGFVLNVIATLQCYCMRTVQQ